MKIERLLLLAMLLLMVAFVQAAIFKQIQFIDEYDNPMKDLTYVKVYNAGTPTASTIYKDRSKNNAITNPMTETTTNSTLWGHNGMVSFWSVSQATHDIEAMVGGRLLKIPGIGPSETRICVPAIARQSALRKKGCLMISNRLLYVLRSC